MFEVFQGCLSQGWTLDEPADCELLTKNLGKLYLTDFSLMTHEILTLLKEDSNLSSINNGIVSNEGYMKSLSNEDTVK